MHVLVVTHNFPPGQEVAAVRPARLVQALRSRGHAVTVITGVRESATTPSSFWADSVALRQLAAEVQFGRVVELLEDLALHGTGS